MRRCLALIVTAAIAGSGLVLAAAPAGAFIPGFASVNQPVVSLATTVVNLPIADAGTITDVDVAVRIDHTFDADLDIHVRHPDGTLIELSTDNGGAGDNYGAGAASCAGTLTVFNQDTLAGSITTGTAPFLNSGYLPEGTLDALDGKPANGTWKLEVTDDAAADSGTVRCFQVRLSLDTGNTIIVNTTADALNAGDGLVSLREAFDIARTDGGPTTIHLADGASYSLQCGSPGTSQFQSSGTLFVTAPDSTVVEGHGATIQSACAGGRIFEAFNTTSSMTLRDMTLTGGSAHDQGGAIYYTGSGDPDLLIERVSLTGNSASDPSCTIMCSGQGGAIYAGDVDLTIRDSTITGNSASSSGCDAFCAASGGGIVANGGTATIERSDISGNHVTLASSCVNCFAQGGGMVAIGDSATIDRSTVSQNTVTFGGSCTGTCAIRGGGAVLFGPSTHVISTTVAGNVISGSEAVGGGMFIGTGPAELSASTVADNAAPTGANLHIQAASVTVGGTVVSGPSGSGCGFASAGSVTSSGYNFESGTDCGLNGIGDVGGGGDPTLAPLSGLLPVRAPLPGSPLIDAIPAGSCAAIVDQLGLARPQGLGCDIGAVETAPSVAASRFVALPPARVFDTRPESSAPGPKGLMPAGGVIAVQVTGVAGVPSSDVSAVVLNVTATDTAAPGFVTVWPHGTPQPLASSLNLTASAQTRPNLVTVPVSPDGRISLFTQGGGHLLGDIAGYYRPVASAQRSGRLVPLTPSRIFDSRLDQPAPGPKGFIAAGETVTVQIGGAGGVPGTGVSAVVLNVTATEAAAAGFVTVWPTGQPQPVASVLNLNGPGDTAPNLVIVPLGAGGSISLFSQSGAHLLADVTGYFTDQAAPPSSSGLYVPLPPTRVFDTRPGEPAPGPKGLTPTGGAITTAFGGLAAIPLDAAAVVVNLTGTGATGSGFVTSWPTGQPQPLASTLNLAAGDTRANAAILPLGGGGRLNHFTQHPTHLLADTTGYYTP